MPLANRTFSVSDFSGGITDEAVGSRPNQSVTCDNFLVNAEKQLITRPGSRLYYTTSGQIPSGSQNLHALWNYDNDTALLVQGKDRIYVLDASAGWTQITGPTSNVALGGAATGVRLSSSEWQKQLYITNDGSNLPIKIFKVGSSYTVLTAGLPALAQEKNYVESTIEAACVDLVNELRIDMLAHMEDTTQDRHATDDSVNWALIGAAATGTASAYVLTGQLLRAYYAHVQDSYLASPVYHNSPGYVPGFNAAGSFYYSFAYQVPSLKVPESLPEMGLVLNDLKLRYNAHTGFQDDPHNTGVAVANLTVAADVAENHEGTYVSRVMTKILLTANKMKTRMNLHFADNTGLHATTTSAITASDATDLTTLVVLIQDMIAKYDAHDQDAETDGSAHAGVESQDHSLAGIDTQANNVALRFWPVFENVRIGEATLEACVIQLADIAAKYNGHDSDTSPHGATEGAYQVNEQWPIIGNYLYALHYQYEYTIGTVSYVDKGPVYEYLLEDSCEPFFENLTVAGIPSLTNGSTLNYATSTITVQVYRSTVNGTDLYRLGQVTNGTTTFADRYSDEEILSNELIYTTGGVLENDPPPLAKYLHIAGNTGYYGYITSGSILNGERIRQSIPDDPDACPEDFYVDLDDDVKGISSARTIPIAFTAKQVYRLEGRFDELGRGGIEAVSISVDTGLVGSYSLVQIDDGVLFAGTDGFYFTDGYNVVRLSGKWKTTYQNLISSAAKAKNITGVFDKVTKRVWWGVSQTSSTVNDKAFILDLNYGLGKDEALFTTASNTTHFAPTAWTFFGGQLIRGDTRGYVFKHEPGELASFGACDPYVETSVATSAWIYRMAIPPTYKSVAFELGEPGTSKWVPQITVRPRRRTGSNTFDIQTNGFNDLSATAHECTPIRVTGSTPVLVEENRYFPAGSLRCSTKQIGFTRGYVVIAVSADLGGNGTVDNLNSTLTKATGTFSNDYAHNCVVAFASDGYVLEYPITAVASSVLAFTDISLTAPASGSHAYIIRGYSATEYIDMYGYKIHFAQLGGTNQDADSESGEP